MTNEPKKYTLKPSEANLLRFTDNHQRAIFSGILSNIASEHGVTVSENTQFKLSSDFSSIEVSELEPQDDPSPVVEAK